MKFTFSHRGEAFLMMMRSLLREHASEIFPFRMIDNVYLPEVLRGRFSVQGTPIYKRTATWCQPNVWLSSVIWNRVMANFETSVSLIMECRPLSTAHPACSPLADLTVCPFFSLRGMPIDAPHLKLLLSRTPQLSTLLRVRVFYYPQGPVEAACVILDPTIWGRRYYYRPTNRSTFTTITGTFICQHDPAC